MLLGTYKHVLYQDVIIFSYQIVKITETINSFHTFLTVKDPLRSLARFSSPLVEARSSPVDSGEQGENRS